MKIKYLMGVLLLISAFTKVYSQIPQATSIDSIFADWDKPETPGAGIPFNEFYSYLGFLCWVPNLIFIEWRIRRLGL